MNIISKIKFSEIISYSVAFSIILTLLISFLFAFRISIPIFSTSTIDTSVFGQFGDALGGIVGTILTFLSVYLIYKTYLSQKEELKATQNALYDQKNDTALFSLLSTARQIVTEMEGDVNIVSRQTGRAEIKHLSGRDYFHNVLENIKQDLSYEHLEDSELIYNPATGRLHTYFEQRTGEFNEHGNEGVRRIPNDTPSFAIHQLQEEVSIAFMTQFEKFSYNFDHYFRYIRNIVEFIETIENLDNRKRYYNFLRSQLSQNELAMIFYFTIAADKNFLTIIDHNKLLQPILHPEMIVDVWHHWFFPHTDFKFLLNSELQHKNQYLENHFT